MNAGHSRRTFLLGGPTTGAMLLAGKTFLYPSAAHATTEVVTLDVYVNMTLEEMADRSQYAMVAWKYLQDAVAEIGNPGLRAAVLGIMKNPAPLLVEGDAKAIMAELKGQGLLAQDVKAVFPTCASTKKSPQPFYTAPGNGWNSYHIYLGGLVTHTVLSVASCKALHDNYADTFSLKLGRDVVLASQLLHNLHKPWVFQQRVDGTCRKEEPLAATGEHHVLSIAESLRRGLFPELCVAQACTHDRPGAAASEQLVVGWLKAAAVVNGKDPFKAGLVEKDGKTLPMPRRMEGFVTHPADHDRVLSVPAAQWTVDALKQIAVRSYGIKEVDLVKKPFNQFRNYVLSQKTAMQLYGAYSIKGLDGLTTEVAEIVRA